MTVAIPGGSEGWEVAGETVGELASLLARLRERAGTAPAVFGVDAPIGLPLAFHRPFRSFPAFLASLSRDDPFYDVCDDPADIGPGRPFYPRSSRPGSRRSHLHDRLGLDADELLRRCERAIPPAAAASPLFWTLGAKQAGKGAIRLWRDVLGDALRGPDPPALWPFDGELAGLSRPGRTTVAETYPADALRWIAPGFRGSKRRQSDRARIGDDLRRALADCGAVPDAALAARIDDGFGPSGDGEDEFDSLLGLIRMLQVVQDPALDQLPCPAIRRWEGWILGRPVSIS